MEYPYAGNTNKDLLLVDVRVMPVLFRVIQRVDGVLKLKIYRSANPETTMLIQESCFLTKKLRSWIDREDISNIAKICKTLGLPQKTLAVSNYNFFSAKAECKIEPDDVVLVSSAINLACKTCETPRSLKKIIDATAHTYKLDIDTDIYHMYIEAIGKTEIDILGILDFDFQITTVYPRLQKLCGEMDFDPQFSRRCWITLNDLLCTSLSVYFTVEEFIACSVFTNFLIQKTDENEEIKENDVYEAFVRNFEDFKGVGLECLKFMIGEILELYKG